MKTKMTKNENENEKTLILSKDEKEKENETIKELNDYLDEIIDKSKSFEEQIKSLKKPRRSKTVLAL